MLPRTIWRSICLLPCLTILASGQEVRYELGKRLRRFEIAWQSADAARRAACVPSLQRAVESFFGFRLSRAGQMLDRAWFQVRAEQPPTPFQAFAAAQAVTLRVRVDDASAPRVRLQIKPFYDTDPPPEGGIEVRLQLVRDGRTWAEQRSSWGQLQAETEWDLGTVPPPGDFWLEAELHQTNESAALAPVMISRMRDLDARLERLAQRVQNQSQPLADYQRATLAELLLWLRRQQSGFVMETDLPSSYLLEFAEAIMEDDATARPFIAQQARARDVWLTLAQNGRRVPVRLRAPAASSPPFPVLFLLHGAGGSENMFFDAYGAGRCVTLALERGWLVVAPRQTVFGLSLDCQEMLAELEPIFPIDRTRVFVLGHSMGAAQAVRQVALHPDLFRAAAALGGGGRTGRPERLAGVPWFVAAGAQDFGAHSARRLRTQLESVHAPHEFRVYPDTEHMAIVQAAADDVFQAWDRLADFRKPPDE